MTNAEFVDSLRQIADFYEAHPEVPPPFSAPYLCFYPTKEQLPMIIRAFGSCKKEVSEERFRLNREFGSLTITASWDRNAVCTQRTVEKVVSEVVWDCPESLLAPKAEQGEQNAVQG